MSIELGNIGNVSVKEAITAVYVGYFNRAPDPSGLEYWISRYEEFENGTGGADIDAGLSLQGIAESFSRQTESRDEYPFFETPNVASATAFIIQVYANLFNRAPDDDGRDYWVNELVSGNQPVGGIILSIIGGAKNDANGQDITVVQNKIAVGIDWVMDAADAGVNADPFTDDAEAVAGAKAALDGVDETQASVDAAVIATDVFFAGFGNDAPTATTTAATANEDAVLNSFVEGTDPDAGDTLTFSVAASSTTSNGTLVMSADGSYVYTPNADFVGSDSFTYTVTDAAGATGTGTVAITVNNTNDAPVAGNVIATTAEDNGVVVTPVSSDIDAGDTATFSVGSNPTNGTVVANANGTFTYTPNANFNGTDSFTYIVTDTAGATSLATATVTVTAVDDAPVAADSSVDATEGAAVVTGSVSATDIDSANITFALDAAAPAGLTFNNDGTFSFDPTAPAYDALDAGDVATIVVPFTASADGQSDGGVLTVTVTGTNDVPTASAVTSVGLEDDAAITVTAITSDADADDTATFSVSANPSNGTVVNNNDGTFTYTPNADFNGTDTFEYTVTDSQGATASATASVTVVAENDAPEFGAVGNGQDALSASTFEDQAVSGQLTANDVDGDALTYTVTDDVDNGSLVFNANGSYVYTPNADFNGSDSFTVSVADGNGGTDTALVTISIAAVDDVLTTAIDDIAGGAADDLFLANGQTLNPGDSIDGGAGNDTLFVATTGATALTAFLTSNLENITFTHDTGLAGGELTVDLSSTSGVDLVTVENSFEDVNLRFMEGNNVELNNLTAGVDVLIDGRNGALTGTNDALNINVVGSQTTDPDTGNIVVDNAYEVVNLTTGGANGPVSIADLRTNKNTDTVPPVNAPNTGANTVNIDASETSLSIGDSDASGVTRNSTDAVMGIENSLDANVRTVDASASSQGVTFSVADANGSTNLTGGSAGDNIEGSANNDNIDGGAGNDNIAGEGGNDVITGGDGFDYITGQAGNDTITGDNGTGIDGSDSLFGNAGNDNISGNGGNDVIDTGSFSDGAGTEVVDAGADSDNVTTRGEFLNGRALPTDSLTPNGAGAANNVDQLAGGDGIDNLSVNGSSADVNGLNDVTEFETVNLNGGTFNYTIGNNSAFEADHDARVSAAGADGMTTIDGSGAGNSVNVNATTLDEAITLNGARQNDVLLGGRGNDTIEGNATSGNGNGGDDFLMGGAGDDTFLANTSDLDGGDTIEGDSGDDTIVVSDDNGRTSGLIGSSGDAVMINGNVSGIQTIKVQDTDAGDQGDITVNFMGFNNQGDATAAVHDAGFADALAAGTDDTRLIVDGSELDAGESLTVVMANNGVDEDISVLGGAGNDFIAMGEYLDSGDAINGADGFDEVHVTGAQAGDFTNVSNIECIRITDATNGEVFVFGADAEAAFAAGVTPIIKLDNNPGVNITVDTTAFAGGVIIEDNTSDNTINLGGGADTVIASTGDDTINGGGGDDVVVVSGMELDANDTLNLGAGSDTVQMDNSFDAVVATSNLTTNATVENYVLTNNGDVFAGTGNNAADFDDNSLTFTGGMVNTLTMINVNAEALTDVDDTFTVTLDAGQTDADFAFNVEGSAVGDTFVKENVGVDNNIDFNGNDGADNFILDGGDAGSTTVYDGGTSQTNGVEDIDTVTLSGSAITDDGFVSMSNIENLDSVAGLGLVARLGIEADQSGLSMITGSDVNDDVETDPTFNNDLTVTTGLGDDNFDFNASSGTITFQADASEITAADMLSGGTTANDEIQLTADNGMADLSTTTGVETITVVEDGDNDIEIMITDNTFTDVASGMLTIDASALDDTGVNLPEGALTLTAGGVTNALDVTGGTGDDMITTGTADDTVSSGAGNDTVITGDGADTVILGDGNDAAVTGAGDDVVNGDAGDDYIEAGAGNDVVNGGTGDDTIYGADGIDELTGGDGADEFGYTAVSDSRGLTRDTIFDFNTAEGDVIALETALIFAADPTNIGLGVPQPSTVGIGFAGNTTNFSDAQGAISLTANDGVADFVLEASGQGPNGASKLWIDVNDDGILNGLDVQIFLLNDGAAVQTLTGDEVIMVDTINPIFPVEVGSVTEDAEPAGDNETLVNTTGTFDAVDPAGVTYSYDGAGTVGAQVGGFGTLTIDAAGAFTYAINDAQVEQLAEGETQTDQFTIVAEDPTGNETSSTYTVNLTGANDSAVIFGTTSGSVQESGTIITGPTSTGDADHTDVDNNNADDVWQVAAGASDNAFGNYTVDAAGVWSYTLDNANPTVDALGTATSTTDTFTITTEDGTTGAVTVNIFGANDAAVITGPTTAVITEGTAATSTVTGDLDHTDVDNNNNDDVWMVEAATASANGFGTTAVAADGTWTFTLDNNNATINALGAGSSTTDVITLTTEDGTTEMVTITINGANDAAVITGATTGSVLESGVFIGLPTSTGDLNHTDVDLNNADDVWQVVAGGTASNVGFGTYGNDAAGVWTYMLDDANPLVDALGSATTATDTITVTTEDGTTQAVTITINGANDAAVITGATTGSVAESGTTAGFAVSTGNLEQTDVDNNNNDDVWAAVVAPTLTGTGFGNYVMDVDGNWTYTLDNTNPTIDALGSVSSTSDTFTVATEDGTTQVVTVNIAGGNDAAIITGATIGTVTESGTAVGVSTVTGDLNHTDVDNNNADDVWTASAAATTLGSYAMDAAGVWTYTVDNANTVVDALGSVSSTTDTFTVATEDGTTQVVTVNIVGANDAAIITGATTGSVTESGTAVGVSTVTGDLGHTDVDNNNADDVWTVSAAATTLGNYAIDAAGVWTYTVDNANTVVDALGSVSSTTDMFTVATEDGTTQVVTVNIVGANDAAIITGATGGTVTESGTAAGVSTVTGDLNHTDVDNNNADDVWTVSAAATTLGNYAIDAAGVWTYTLDDANPTVDALGSTSSTSDTFTVATEDGTTQVVTVVINGANDAAVITGATAGSVTEGTGVGTATVTGDLAHTDVDNNNADDVWTASAAAPSDNGFGTFAIDAAGVWTFVLDNANTTVDALALGETATDTFTVATEDGTTQQVTVTINGSNDAPVLEVAPTVSGTTISFEVSDVDTSDTLSYVTPTTSGDTAVTKGDVGGGGAVETVTATAQAVATATFLQVTDDGTNMLDITTLIEGTVADDVMSPPASGGGIYFGFGGDDAITGGAADDIIVGGLGADTIDGAGGNDTILYNAAAESGTSRATADDLTAFVSGGGDLIDLQALAVANTDVTTLGTSQGGGFANDLNGGYAVGLAAASAAMAGGDDFVVFSATAQVFGGAVGPVETYVAIDSDGDNVADMTIEIAGGTTVLGADFLI